MKFIAETALEYARTIARPRRVGSGEEKVVAEEVASRLRKFGYRVEQQPFRFSDVLGTAISAEILIGLSLILLSCWARSMAYWAPLVPAILLAVLVVSARWLIGAVEEGSLAPDLPGRISPWTALCLRLGRPYDATNLIAALAIASSAATLPHLYLVAHYDSKSQRLPLAIRIALFSVTLAGSLAFTLLTVLGVAIPGLIPAANVVGAVVILAGTPLLFLDVGNDSPGAIDNASGVGTVLHLAQCLAQEREIQARLRITVLITSAEELAVMGAAAFVRRHKHELRQQAETAGLYILNFDGPGVDGRLYLADGRGGQLAPLIREACNELGLELGRFSMPGALFDHIPFARHGFDAVSLIAIGRATRAIHTPGDSVEKLHAQGFARAGNVALHVIEKLSHLRS